MILAGGFFIKLSIAAIFSGFAVIAFVPLLTGKINTTGLIQDPNGQVSPARIQLLVTTVLGLASYAVKVVNMDHSEGVLPEFDQDLLMVLGGSHAVHLGAKFYQQVLGSLRG